MNLFYIKDHETWVRGYGPAPEYADVSLFDLTRDIVKTHIPDAELPEDNDNLSNMMPEWLMDGIDSAEGIVALLYTAAWAYAELRHKLMRYEDTGLEPEEIADFMKRWERAVEIAGLCKKRGIEQLEHLLELKKAENDGHLVVLPCKVGDDVWFIRKFGKGQCIKRAEVDCVNIDSRGNVFVSARRISGGYIGKTVFLTREEAEPALAQKGGDLPEDRTDRR